MKKEDIKLGRNEYIYEEKCEECGIPFYQVKYSESDGYENRSRHVRYVGGTYVAIGVPDIEELKDIKESRAHHLCDRCFGDKDVIKKLQMKTLEWVIKKKGKEFQDVADKCQKITESFNKLNEQLNRLKLHYGSMMYWKVQHESNSGT